MDFNLTGLISDMLIPITLIQIIKPIMPQSWEIYAPFLFVEFIALMVAIFSLDKFKRQLAKKTKELDSLSTEVVPLREKVHALENSLTDKDREVGTKSDEVFQKDKEINTLENQTAEMQKKIDSQSYEVLLAKEECVKIREELEKTRLTKYIMTIEVDRKNKDDEFNIIDLMLFHRDCSGGLITVSRCDHGYSFECERCDVIHGIDDDDNNKLGVVNTAINGTEYTASCSESGYKDIKFIQKQSAV